MNSRVEQIIVTETSLAILITVLTMLIAADSVEMIRATAALLYGSRLLFALSRVIVTQGCALLQNCRRLTEATAARS